MAIRRWSPLLLIQSVLEIDKYVESRESKNIEKPKFTSTRDFLKHFTKEYNDRDLLFENNLWSALRGFTQKNIITRQDFRKVWDSYQADLMLIANSDMDLMNYGSSRLSLGRIQELKGLLIAVGDEFMASDTNLGKRYVA